MNYIDDIKLTKNSLNQYVLMKKFFIINNSINSLHVYIKWLTILFIDYIIFLGVFMRVISGKYKGKVLVGFDLKGTRPTKDRVKESIFGSIQNIIKDSIFLDLFAGSGSIGIEALSNGSNKCYFVDNGEIIKVLNNNLKGIDNGIIINNDYLYALEYFKNNNIKFDIIYIDPPYHLGLMNKAIKYIEDNCILNKKGIIICEYEEENPICNYDLIKEKKYGKTNIKIFKK